MSHDPLFQEAVSLRVLVQAAADYVERNAIFVALHETGWSKSKTAQKLKISIPALTYKMKYHGLERSAELKGEGPGG